MSMKKRKWLKTMFTGCVLGSLLITQLVQERKQVQRMKND